MSAQIDPGLIGRQRLEAEVAAHRKQLIVRTLAALVAAATAQLLSACTDEPAVMSCSIARLPLQAEVGGLPVASCTEYRGKLTAELVEMERRLCEPGVVQMVPCPKENMAGSCEYLSSVDGDRKIEYYYHPIPKPHTYETLVNLCSGTWRLDE